MCGRFAQYSSLSSLKKAFLVSEETCGLTPSYNIAPYGDIPAIIRRKNINRLGRLYWGLVPAWTKDRTGKKGLINARAETLMEKPSFKKAFRHRRCLIPADGYYEWEKKKNHKQPWFFVPKSGNPFAFAGIWETWRANDESLLHSCAIITTQAAGGISGIHHRMPVILLPAFFDAWLDPAMDDVTQLEGILREGHDREITGYPVSTFVNSVKNDGPECMERA